MSGRYHKFCLDCKEPFTGYHECHKQAARDERQQLLLDNRLTALEHRFEELCGDVKGMGTRLYTLEASLDMALKDQIGEKEKALQLEVGKTYVTRKGEKVKIIFDKRSLPSGETNYYPITGVYLETAQVASWRENGRVGGNDTHNLDDILRELSKDDKA